MVEDPEWVRSSFCLDMANCFEIAVGSGRVYVRNSTDRSAVVTFSEQEFAVFLAGVKSGDFDNLMEA